jgi:hypothetical protein
VGKAIRKDCRGGGCGVKLWPPSLPQAIGAGWIEKKDASFPFAIFAAGKLIRFY